MLAQSFIIQFRGLQKTINEAIISNMKIDRWWRNNSVTPQEAFRLGGEEDRTRPLSNVVELRSIAAEINFIQLTQLSEGDAERMEVTVLTAKDGLLPLNNKTREHFNLGEYVSPEEKVEVSIPANGDSLFLKVVSEGKGILYSFDSNVTMLTIKELCMEDGDWVEGEERLMDDYSDAKTVLELLKEELDSVGRSRSF